MGPLRLFTCSEWGEGSLYEAKTPGRLYRPSGCWHERHSLLQGSREGVPSPLASVKHRAPPAPTLLASFTAWGRCS